MGAFAGGLLLSLIVAVPVSAAERAVAFVANEESSTVSVLAGPPFTVVATIPVAPGPQNLALNPSGTLLAVTSPGADAVTLIDPAARKAGPRLAVEGRPHAIAFYGERRLLVTLETAFKVVALEPPEEKPLEEFPLPFPPHDVVVDRARAEAWVTGLGTELLHLIALRRMQLKASLTARARPHSVALVPGGGAAWITGWGADRVFYINRDGSEASVLVGDGPEYLAVTPNGAEVWISRRGSKEVAVVTTRTSRVMWAVPVGDGPQHIAMSADGRFVFIASKAGGTVTVFDAATKRPIAKLSVGKDPHGIVAR
jgi:DNA-binding beta-propeller fold protein YncE